MNFASVRLGPTLPLPPSAWHVTQLFAKTALPISSFPSAVGVAVVGPVLAADVVGVVDATSVISAVAVGGAASLLASGAVVSFGSDWPVTSVAPLEGIAVAVTRQTRGGHPAQGWIPHERVSLDDALTAYTAGSAYVNHLDDTGQIRVGALADLAVLDRDPFAGKPDEIGATRVLQTFVDGQRVFASDDA